MTPIHTLDLNFQGYPGAIAAYLIPHQDGVTLLECGPGSTIPALIAGLEAHGYRPEDVTEVVLTHIHLDHAGASGWLARQGAEIYVHPNGAPHLLNPEKLLASASRIYGPMMDTLWGEFLPVPEERLHIVQDEEILDFHGLQFKALDTPGHASHHNAYMFENTCFTGDIGGVRLNKLCHLRLPMPPPEFVLEKWRQSLERIRAEKPARVAPIHFGIYEDAEWHIDAALQALDEAEAWMERVMPSDPPIEKLRQEYMSWMRAASEAAGLDEDSANTYEAANPSFMSADGMQRYWKKYRGVIPGNQAAG